MKKNVLFMFIEMFIMACSVKGYKNGEIELTPNTDYSINDPSSIELSNYQSTDNLTARCYITVTFHN